MRVRISFVREFWPRQQHNNFHVNAATIIENRQHKTYIKEPGNGLKITNDKTINLSGFSHRILGFSSQTASNTTFKIFRNDQIIQFEMYLTPR